MKRVGKRLVLIIGLTLLAGILVGFPVGRAIGSVSLIREMIELQEADSPEEGSPRTSEPVVEALEVVVEGRTDSVYPVVGSLEGTITFGLVSPKGSVAVKVNGSGDVLWAVRFPDVNLLPTDVRELPNGNLLVLVINNGVYEVSPLTGEVVWSWISYKVSHHAQRLPNGNTVIVKSAKGGAYEITREGETVWEWVPSEEILQYTGEVFPGMTPDLEDMDVIRNIYSEEGIHMNTAYRTKYGTTFLSLRNLDLVIEVDMENNVLWSYGPMVLKHQHSPSLLENGNILIFDNGNGRVIEVTRSHEIVWEYQGFVSPVMGNAQRLPNGLTLITDSTGGDFNAVTSTPRVFAVDQAGNVVWELRIPSSKTNPYWTGSKTIYRAWWNPE